MITTDIRDDKNVYEDVLKAIRDEWEAIIIYTDLAKMSPNKIIADALLEIRQDEIRHFHHFTQIFRQGTGEFPQFSIVVAPQTDFRKGIEAALKDETETVGFYRGISKRLVSPESKHSFWRASLDEKEHAEILKSMLHYL